MYNIILKILILKFYNTYLNIHTYFSSKTKPLEFVVSELAIGFGGQNMNKKYILKCTLSPFKVQTTFSSYILFGFEWIVNVFFKRLSFLVEWHYFWSKHLYTDLKTQNIELIFDSLKFLVKILSFCKQNFTLTNSLAARQKLTRNATDYEHPEVYFENPKFLGLCWQLIRKCWVHFRLIYLHTFWFCKSVHFSQ